MVTDDALDAVEAALLEALEELSPMDFGFTEGDADAEDGALAVRVDAQSDQDGAIEQLAVVADLFVTGINDQVRASSEGAVAPTFQFGIQLGGAVTDLGGTDGGAAELLDDGGDFAGGDALDVHFCQGQFEGLLTAAAFFQGAG